MLVCINPLTAHCIMMYANRLYNTHTHTHTHTHTVVTAKELKKQNDVWVSPNSDYVCTRFFFVYDNDFQDVNMDTRQPAFRKEIDFAVAHIQAFRKRK